MKIASLLSLACATALASAAQSAIIVDGAYDVGYGAFTAYVPHSDTAVDHVFTPQSGTTGVGYKIYLKGDAGKLYGLFVADSAYNPANRFLNLYLDLDPATSTNGSDFIISLGANGAHADSFYGGSVALDGVEIATTATSFEFSIPNIYLTAPVSDSFTYDGPVDFPTSGSSVRLRATQSLSYTYVGGAAFGDGRLGTPTLAAAPAAVPEPASWAMMVGGFGLLGGALRRRRAVAAHA